MRNKILLLCILTLAGSFSAAAQTATPATPAIPKMKVAIIDYLAFRELLTELKVKYEKLQKEFLTISQELETSQATLAAQEKTLGENKGLTPQQAAKLSADFETGKKEYQRKVEDAQALARRRETEETDAIYTKIGSFLEQYCTKHGITTVFDARRLQETGVIVYAAPGAIITEDFVKAYNAANPAPAK
ncbi:MAG: OmpH family outer membrane protein [Acidobacteria bacterium]|nr:OmpH family outer membrane protein [Acidobacteriota bacterium]